MKQIKLTRGKVAIVDDRDFDLLNQHKWSYTRTLDGNEYAMRQDKKQHWLMHRFILSFPTVQIDHINGNGLDNRRLNLRLATNQLNQANAKIRKKTISGRKGVARNGSGWMAKIWKDKVSYYLGTFKTIQEASNAYMVKAKEFYGEFARSK